MNEPGHQNPNGANGAQPYWIWVRFNIVGLFGIPVQLGALSLLVALSVPYLPATLLAVEAAIMHNFVWHQRWTWKAREGASLIHRFLGFNFSSGLLSLVGNAIITPLLVERFSLGILTASMVAIGACSIANFFMADRLVFR